MDDQGCPLVPSLSIVVLLCPLHPQRSTYFYHGNGRILNSFRNLSYGFDCRLLAVTRPVQMSTSLTPCCFVSNIYRSCTYGATWYMRDLVGPTLQCMALNECPQHSKGVPGVLRHAMPSFLFDARSSERPRKQYHAVPCFKQLGSINIHPCPKWTPIDLFGHCWTESDPYCWF